jgi:drug/metabolite transporter (DMT)-like permease
MTSIAPARRSTSGALAGVGFMLLGVFLFASNDAMGKWLVGSYAVGQILLVRSISALAVLVPFWRREGWRRLVRPPRLRLQIARAVCSALEVGLFYWALSSMSLATVMTFYLAGPIYVTALGALVLGERVGWVRWSAVLVGFAGVLVALGPGIAEAGPAALIAIAGSFAYAVLIITTRILVPSGEVTLITWQTASALVFGLVLTPIVGWTPPSAFDWIFLLLLGLVSMTAHVCVNRSLLLAPASTVVPYQYTLIVWAIIFGAVFFGEQPTPALLLGAALITGSGVFIFLREQRLGREAASVAAAPPEVAVGGDPSGRA